MKDFKDLPPLPTIAGSAKGEAWTPRRLRCPGGRKSKEKQGIKGKKKGRKEREVKLKGKEREKHTEEGERQGSKEKKIKD